MKDLWIEMEDIIVVECSADGYYPDSEELYDMTYYRLKKMGLL